MIATAPSREDRALLRAGPAALRLGPVRRHLTLRVKGALAVAVLLLYLVCVSVLFVVQKDALLRDFHELGAMHQLQDRLHNLGLALARVTAAAQAESRQDASAAPDQSLILAIDDVLQRAEQQGSDLLARGRLAAAAAALRAYRASVPGAVPTGVARTLEALLAELGSANARLDARQSLREAEFRAQSQTMAVTVFAVGLLGIALIGAVVVLFLARITSDLEALRLRAGDIIAGRQRSPIPVTRPDEVGALTGAINELASALEARERELELERRKVFHHEKMAAIGNLAAGVLTEIGNPIAAIDGFARSLRDELRGGRAPESDGAGSIDQILEQTVRLTTIAHEISEISAPQPQQRQLVDLNAVVKNAVRLLHYDTRARAVGIEMKLDHQLPAIPGMAEKLSHLVMILAGTAIDALGDYRAGEPGITIATTGSAAGIVLEVADRGVGMSDAVRARALEPFFSTKPAGQGTGLGLPLCRSIVAEHGGTIGLDSAPGKGIRVTVTLPHA